MAILLRQLEQNVPEDALVLAEELIEQNAVQALQMVDSKLWIARVLTYEVELKATRQRLQEATCECARFKATQMCEHVVASALVLRRQLTEEETTKQLTTPASATSTKKLTTKSILQQLSPEELRRFVQEYASRDRNFALALKTRFVGQVELSDDKNKYLQLIEDAIKNARKKDRNISQRGKQKLLKVANELLHQVDAALAQKYYRSVLYIAQSFIERLTPILRKMDDPKDILAIITTSFQLLKKLATSPIPPDLMDELWDYSITEFQKVTYRINEVVPSFFDLQYLLAKELNQEIELLARLNKFANQDMQTTENETRLLIHRMALMDELNETTQANQLLQDHTDHPDLLLFVIQKSFERKAYEQTKQLAKQALQLTLPSTLHRQLIDILLAIAQLENNAAAIAHYAEQRLFQTKQTEDYDLLKVNYSGGWDKKWKDVLKRIQRTSFSIERRNLVAHIYAEEGEFDTLIDYIYKLQSLDVLEYVAPILFSKHAAILEQLYRDLMTHYLQHHLGRQASLRVHNKLNHLATIGATRMSRYLAAHLRTIFPERHTLLEELANF
jgi:hypothetical protein